MTIMARHSEVCGASLDTNGSRTIKSCPKMPRIPWSALCPKPVVNVSTALPTAGLPETLIARQRARSVQSGWASRKKNPPQAQAASLHPPPTMRVKKPSSKRGTTRMREGIKKKASAHRRKERKLAKKDVTWKSRVTKDPGIPASFPYKEEIIQELEESRLAEKQRRQELRAKRQQERQEAAGAAADIDIDGPGSDDTDNGAEGGLAALLDLAQQAAREYDGDDDSPTDAMDEDDVEWEISDAEVDADLDKSRKSFDKIFKAVVDASDVVLYVLDARDPESTRSRKVEEAVLQAGNKRLMLVLNKVDLIPPHVLKKWLDYLNLSFPTVPLKAAAGGAGSSAYNKTLSSTVTAKQLLQALKAYALKSNLKRAIVVGVIGYPNVGKLSIINALTNRHHNLHKACPVGNVAGVTTVMREVKVDSTLRILDSPGIVFPDEVSGKKAVSESKLALLSAIPPKTIRDPTAVVEHLLRRLAKDDAMADAVKQYYLVPPLPLSNVQEYTKQFLIHVARSRGRLSRGGIPNLEAAALTILSDWRDGRITGWTLPNPASQEPKDPSGPKSALRGEKEPAKQENTTIVTEWAREFDLDGLLGDQWGLDA